MTKRTGGNLQPSRKIQNVGCHRHSHFNYCQWKYHCGERQVNAKTEITVAGKDRLTEDNAPNKMLTGTKRVD